MLPVDLGQMRKLEEYLQQAANLRLVLVGGSIDEGSMIVVLAEKPVSLDVLRTMLPVEQVVEKKITVTLKPLTGG